MSIEIIAVCGIVPMDALKMMWRMFRTDKSGDESKPPAQFAAPGLPNVTR
jgi:hypothetical protein